MFKDFEVSSYRGNYQVKFSTIQGILEEEVKEGDIVLIDSNIMKLYPEIAKEIKQVRSIIIETNEKAKSYHEIGELISSIIDYGFSKNNRLIAIGGGVIQDITAFSSSILFRGVDWVFFPTNLLTQCDSCIGSKTSVNLGDYKNQLGGFWPPKKIFIDFNFCQTLSQREICSGLGEMMHYFLVDKSCDLNWLEEIIHKAKSDKALLAILIEKSLAIKKTMVEKDEFDTGPRNVFNYGHSFGHAIEATTDFAIPHGIAVAYGMDLANIISAKQGLISYSLRNRIRKILETIWDETPLPEIDLQKYFLALSKDKKNVGSDIKVILTRGTGSMFKTSLERNQENETLIENYFEQKWYGTEL